MSGSVSKKKGGYREDTMTLHAERRRKERKGYQIMLEVFCNKEDKLYLHLDPKLENRTACWGLQN